MISSFKFIDTDFILAIDLKKGRVVKAFAGFRLNYKPLKIGELDFSDPYNFIELVLKYFRLTKIYIADLDAIQSFGSNFDLLCKLLKSFPKIDFLIDYGFDYPVTVNNFVQKLDKKKIKNFSIVLGTEKLKKYNLRCFKQKVKIHFSLDILNDSDQWVDTFKKSRFKADIILMFLRNVGGRGVRIKSVRAIKKRLPGFNLLYAGGVKYFRDIKSLKNVGVESVIVSTLVHKHLGR